MPEHRRERDAGVDAPETPEHNWRLQKITEENWADISHDTTGGSSAAAGRTGERLLSGLEEVSGITEQDGEEQGDTGRWASAFRYACRRPSWVGARPVCM